MGHKRVMISQILIWMLLHSTSSVPEYNTCDEGTCTPTPGDLLIGRENLLSASSTCGLQLPDLLCLATDTAKFKNCTWCDSRRKNMSERYYGVENVVRKNGMHLWWQSQSNIENVTIQLDLETVFYFRHLYLRFKSIRPAGMLVERSADNGQTWQVSRYFAYDCREQFPFVPQESANGSDPTVPYCTEGYSSVSPGHGGEVTLTLAEEDFSTVEFTNLRVNFTKFHNRIDSKDKSFYAIEQMVVMGTCACNGHSSQCISQDGESFSNNMIHGKCKCIHNTTGSHCEKCKDLYNDLAWAPASREKKNECNKCNCYHHAISCHFDSDVFNRNGQVSGGVCDDCQHNTTGNNCEHCQELFYRDPKRILTDPNVCLPCDCDLAGSLNQGICDSASGQCPCKPNVEGRRCDTCKPNYSNLTKSNRNGCERTNSLCNPLGKLDDRIGHAAVTTECVCKSKVTGVNCDQCVLKYWGLDESPEGCKPCHCDPGGSVNEFCDVVTGQCSCRPHLAGRTCDTAEPSYYTRPLNYQILEAEVDTWCSGVCTIETRPNNDSQWAGIRRWWTGPGYMRMSRDAVLDFRVKQIAASIEFNASVRYELQAPDEDGDGTMQLTLMLLTNDEANLTVSHVREVTLRPGPLHAETQPPFCLEVHKLYFIRLQLTHHYRSSSIASVLIDSVLLVPNIESIPFMNPGPPIEHGRLDDFELCRDAIYSVTDATLSRLCQAYHFSIGAYIYGGAYPCRCHPIGSYNSTCELITGKCYCKPNVADRKCDTCSPGSYGFSRDGCKACDCHSDGSLNNFCDLDGQCTCKPKVVGRSCDRCQPGWWNFPNCQECTCNGLADNCDHLTGVCTGCKNSTDGSKCEK